MILIFIIWKPEGSKKITLLRNISNNLYMLFCFAFQFIFVTQN